MYAGRSSFIELGLFQQPRQLGDIRRIRRAAVFSDH
jgi:hypothetical protein